MLTGAIVFTNVGTAAAATGLHVTMTSPTGGSSVSGTVNLTATASTDPTVSDWPSDVTFYVDGSDAYTYYCSGSRTCNATGQWDSTGLSGHHTITAELTTENDVIVTSPPITVGI